MKGFLLDTHAWIWLKRRETRELKLAFFAEVEDWQRRSCLYASAISVLEIARLVTERRLNLGMSVDQFVAEAEADAGLQLLPLTTRILIESTRLPGRIHRDPSDRLLVATAREHGLTLVTRDDELLQYAKQGHLNVREI